MKRAPFVLLTLFGFCAGFALAQSPEFVGTTRSDKWRFLEDVRFNKSVVFGGGHGVTNSTKGTLVYDFPTLGGASAALDTVCAYSSAGFIDGGTFGDTCLLGVDQVPVNAFGTLVPYITAANEFKVQACALGITDAGSFNMPDASYTVRCFR